MVRLDRNNPDLWFGFPGKLLKLPWPRGGVTKPYERQTYDFVTGSGVHAVSSLSTGSRIYDLAWSALHVDSFAKLEQFRTGMNGPGPWVLIDPSAPNLLPPNVAAATGLYADASELDSALGSQGVPLSNADATFVHRAQGYRSIRWYFSVAAAASPSLGVVPLYRSWPGHPVVPSTSYTWSSWVRPDNILDSSVQVSMRLQWLGANGSQLSESTSGDITVTGWQRLSVTATSPSNAVYVRPVWIGVGATITTGASIYIDEPLLEQDNVVNDWAPATGIRPVEIVALPDTVPFAGRFRTGATMSLRELAR
jgi:hypothetical protein